MNFNYLRMSVLVNDIYISKKCIAGNIKKKNASRDCSRELHKRFTFFFLKSRISAKKALSPSKIVHSASIPWSLRHLPSFSIILRSIERRRSFFFPTLGRTLEETRYYESPARASRGLECNDTEDRPKGVGWDDLFLSAVVSCWAYDILLKCMYILYRPRFLFSLVFFLISPWGYNCFLKFNELCRVAKWGV